MATLFLFQNTVNPNVRRKDRAIAPKSAWLKQLVLSKAPSHQLYSANSDRTARYNLLHLAAFSGDFDAVQRLVDQGISVNDCTESDYQHGIEEKNFWDYSDWDEFGKSRRMLRPEGYLHPIMSPLWIALHFHPVKTEIHEYLSSKGGIQIFKPSVNGESPQQFFQSL